MAKFISIGTYNEIDRSYYIIQYLYAWAGLLLLITTCQFDRKHVINGTCLQVMALNISDKNLNRFVDISMLEKPTPAQPRLIHTKYLIHTK